MGATPVGAARRASILLRAERSTMCGSSARPPSTRVRSRADARGWPAGLSTSGSANRAVDVLETLTECARGSRTGTEVEPTARSSPSTVSRRRRFPRMPHSPGLSSSRCELGHAEGSGAPAGRRRDSHGRSLFLAVAVPALRDRTRRPTCDTPRRRPSRPRAGQVFRAPRSRQPRGQDDPGRHTVRPRSATPSPGVALGRQDGARAPGRRRRTPYPREAIQRGRCCRCSAASSTTWPTHCRSDRLSDRSPPVHVGRSRVMPEAGPSRKAC